MSTNKEGSDRSAIQGRQLGSYRIGERLGAGGIGAVHHGTHVRTGRSYAVKILLPESALEPRAMARFRREAEALAALGHASIVAIHDFDVTDDGIGFLVMDLLKGEDLSDRIERAPLGQTQALRIFDQIAEALATAHEAGILHRDLKPSNVFLAQRTGAPERAVLLDFGLAKMIEGDTGGRLTASGATMGTPMYMSPEQAQGLEVDVRTDVYSLAAILFEMLTGTPPFTGPTITAILSKVLMNPPPPMRSIEPGVPQPLEPVVRAALAKNVDERPRSVRTFQAQVHRAMVGVAATTPKSQKARSVPETIQTPLRLTPLNEPPVEARVTPSSHAERRSGLALSIGLGVGLLAALAMVAWVLSRPDASIDEPDTNDPAALEPTLVTPTENADTGGSDTGSIPRHDGPS